MVLEVSRHGLREPGKLFNFTVDPNHNFNGTGRLMPLGKQQHFELGQRFRTKYIDTGFLSARYDPAQIQVQSTHKSRTYLSALYQLMGMFPEDLPTTDDYSTYDIGNEEYLSDTQRKGETNHSEGFNVI